MYMLVNIAALVLQAIATSLQLALDAAALFAIAELILPNVVRQEFRYEHPSDDIDDPRPVCQKLQYHIHEELGKRSGGGI